MRNRAGRSRALLASAGMVASSWIAPTVVAQTVAPVSTTSASPAAADPATSQQPVAPLSDKVAPSWGNIRSFWGDNTPFWGNIRSFWGNVGPYSDDLTPFWGNIRSFNDSATDTTLLPAWGNIRSFAGDVGASWGNIRSFWGNIRSFSDAPSDYTQLAGMIQSMASQSQATFGSAVQAQTGSSFSAAFANPLFAKYGIDLNNPASLQNLDASAREHFFMDWWDGLMNYSGADHVDHWMKEVNWAPSLTQTLGSGRDTTVGILDFSITGEAANNVVKYGGVSTVANGHGAAVASLIVDPIDGKGVMGIAPSASVIAYNPFDASQTAGWADITKGVVMLNANKASVINMSLGVPGWTLNQGWNNVFSDDKLNKALANTVFVIAAGNDGVTQTQNIVWDKHNPAFVVVGSVDPNGNISSFSNQPGTVCLLDKSKCNGDYLMDHFIVAPGEMILVSDGAGGVTRMSGTSFAAPLVSGTIALIQDRWPWLVTHPNDVVGIVLNSAKDLGAPGVDPIYGHGELDVQAALSPLDWSKLTIKQAVNGKIVDVPLNTIKSVTNATRSTWEANSVYFSLFEKTGESYRDFQVPMSTKLTNKTVSINGSAEQFMGYLTSRFSSWIGAPASFANGGSARLSFTDLRGSSQPIASFGDVEASLTMRPLVSQLGFKRGLTPFQSSVQLASADHRFAVQVGNGESAAALGGQAGFTMASDYDPTNGGANPFIGFAAGGSYAKVNYALAPELSISTAFTQRTLERNLIGLPLEVQRALATDPYRAAATNVTVTYKNTRNLTTSFAYTLLHEGNTVLGMGSDSVASPSSGSTTDAATIAADWAVGDTVSLSGSATMGRTRAGDTSGNLVTVGRQGLMSSTYQVALSKAHLLDTRDHMRLTLAQPMHVERGSIDVSMVQIIDRDTGALGVVTQATGIVSPRRRYVAEVLYGRTIADNRAEMNLFGRANLNAGENDGLPGVIGGASFQFSF